MIERFMRRRYEKKKRKKIRIRKSIRILRKNQKRRSSPLLVSICKLRRYIFVLFL